MLSSTSGHHFAGHWGKGVTPPAPPFNYAIDPALIYLNVPLSSTTDISSTSFVNRGSASPTQTSPIGGVITNTGTRQWGVNTNGPPSIPPWPGETNWGPRYLVDNSTNLSALIPTNGVYTSISFWMNVPTLGSNISYMPCILDGFSNQSCGFSWAVKPDLAGQGTNSYMEIFVRNAITSSRFQGAYNSLALNTWKNIVASYTFGGGLSYVFVNGVQYCAFASPAGTAASASPYYFLCTFGQGNGPNLVPTKWNDVRVEANKMYTTATATTLFNSRRAYYGV